MNEAAPPDVPSVEAFTHAYRVLVWLEQRGFPYASVTLYNDGSGAFCIPLDDDPPPDAAIILRELPQQVGPCEYVPYESDAKFAYLKFAFAGPPA